jgi:predicted nucleic acid-binding protein
LSSELWRSIRRYKLERRSRPLQRRADSELDFLETIRVRPAKLLYDTTVYIEVLRDQFPVTGQLMLRAVEAWHSPVTEAELISAVGLLEPRNSRTPVIDKIAAVIAKTIDQRPTQRTIVPDVIVWREASILSGILARLQGFDKGQRRRLLNDALLFVTARRHSCTLLTRNLSDFDLMQQLEPGGGCCSIGPNSHAGSSETCALRVGAC